MLAPLALVTLLQAPVVGADSLTLAKAQLTYGVLGPAREAASVKPGDSVILSFEIQGISTDAAGKAVYTTSIDVLDPSGKSVFKQAPRKFQEFVPLGGATLPAFAQIDLGLETPPGKYSMNVSVTDGGNGATATVKQEVTVSAKGFDIVRLNVAGDADGTVPLAAYGVGQQFWLHAAVTGFKRDVNKQPKVTVEVRVLDANRRPIVNQPFTGVIDRDVPPTADSIPVRFCVPLNRAGDFYIQIAARDDVSREPGPTITFPITVRTK